MVYSSMKSTHGVMPILSCTDHCHARLQRLTDVMQSLLCLAEAYRRAAVLDVTSKAFLTDRQISLQPHATAIQQNICACARHEVCVVSGPGPGRQCGCACAELVHDSNHSMQFANHTCFGTTRGVILENVFINHRVVMTGGTRELSSFLIDARMLALADGRRASGDDPNQVTTCRGRQRYVATSACGWT